MMRAWRDERHMEGTLSPRPPTPTPPRPPAAAQSPRRPASQGSPRGAAGSAHGLDGRASAKAADAAVKAALFQRAKQAMELASQHETMAAQIAALRGSHASLATTCAKLEARVREEAESARRARRDLARHMEIASEAQRSVDEHGAKQLSLQDQLSALRVTVDERDGELAEREMRVSELKRLLATARASLEEVRCTEESHRKGALVARQQTAALEERAVLMRQAHEQSRLAAMQESERRRAEEGKRCAVEVELRGVKEELAAAQLSLERERVACRAASEKADELGRSERRLRASAASSVKKIEELSAELKRLRMSDGEAAEVLVALHAALREAHASLLAQGTSQDAVRRHNEAVFARLFGALRSTAPAVQAHVPEGDGTLASADGTAAALCEAADAQRAATQRVVDLCARERRAWRRREAALLEQVHAARAKLQRYGADMPTVEAVCGMLAEACKPPADITAADLDGQLPPEPFSPGGDYLLPHRDAATPFFP